MSDFIKIWFNAELYEETSVTQSYELRVMKKITLY